MLAAGRDLGTLIDGLEDQISEKIQNRSDSIFKKNRKNSPVLSEKPSIVTHHWSTNPMKGFETYRFLDDNMGDLFDFTYIGRLPEGFEFKKASYIPPISKEELCEELPKHDIYFTASKLEAGANHVLESLAAGLPVVYHKDGGSGVKLKQEFNNSPHIKGTLALARDKNPDSADSQFYIALSTLPHLNGKYTVIGQVTKGLSVLDKISKGDKIISFTYNPNPY